MKFFFSAVIFIFKFWSLKPWIRIGIHPKMLDPDPDEMKADPQPCLGLLPQGVPPHRLNAAAIRLPSVQFFRGAAGCFNCLHR